MEKQHTPGPWKILIEPALDMLSGNMVPTIQTADEKLLIGVICDVEGEVANAHLIAAAPELLGHLEFAVKLLSGLPYGATAQIEAMRAAIAKARGQNVTTPA